MRGYQPQTSIPLLPLSKWQQLTDKWCMCVCMCVTMRVCAEWYAVFVHKRLVSCWGQEVMKWASYSPHIDMEHSMARLSGGSEQEICRNSLTWVMMLSPVCLFYCTHLLTMLGHLRKCSVYTIFELVYPFYIRTVVNHVPHSSDHSIVGRSYDLSSPF